MPAGETIGDDVPASFPAKLTKLLLARFRASGEPITLFPCELIPTNGVVLRDLCAGIARRSGLPEAFLAYLTEDCVWANSLVDRIVSEPLEPAGAVAEPYALWAIEKAPRLIMPCRHAAIRPVDDLKVAERLKLFILNLGHTCLAERWLRDKRPAEETVLEILSDPGGSRPCSTRSTTRRCCRCFAAAGIAEAPAYRLEVAERFRNPFLRHRLSEIAGNHMVKKERRIGGLIALGREVAPGLRLKRLEAILAT